MSLEQQISKGIMEAMKAKEPVRLQTLRNIKKYIIEAKTAGTEIVELPDADVVKIIAKLAKQGSDSAEIYRQQNRADLAEEELAQVADEFYPILNEQHKEAQVDICEVLTVLVDGDKMARVFNNIMKNAIAYSYEGSTITIEARRRDGGGVRVRFINQGDPIPEAKLKVIFEKFYRLDAARATNRGGAGLGLAIAKEIVCAHGGTVACESTPEHTIFTIELPAA